MPFCFRKARCWPLLSLWKDRDTQSKWREPVSQLSKGGAQRGQHACCANRQKSTAGQVNPDNKMNYCKGEKGSGCRKLLLNFCTPVATAATVARHSGLALLASRASMQAWAEPNRQNSMTSSSSPTLECPKNIKEPLSLAAAILWPMPRW